MGKAAKLDVTAAAKMAGMKTAARGKNEGTVLMPFFNRAAGIYAGLAMVIDEALKNAADAELKTRHRRSHR